MFGTKRKKAESAAFDGLKPLLKTLEMTGGIPPGFWRDPYVLGFLISAASNLMVIANGGPLSPMDQGKAMLSLFAALSGSNGVQINEEIMRLHTASHSAYLQGGSNGEKTVCVAFGLGGFDNDPDVVHARQMAVAMSESGYVNDKTLEPAALAGALQKLLFFDIVRERLG